MNSHDLKQGDVKSARAESTHVHEQALNYVRIHAHLNVSLRVNSHDLKLDEAKRTHVQNEHTFMNTFEMM